jgi:hypothetical protein
MCVCARARARVKDAKRLVCVYVCMFVYVCIQACMHVRTYRRRLANNRSAVYMQVVQNCSRSALEAGVFMDTWFSHPYLCHCYMYVMVLCMLLNAIDSWHTRGRLARIHTRTCTLTHTYSVFQPKLLDIMHTCAHTCTCTCIHTDAVVLSVPAQAAQGNRFTASESSFRRLATHATHAHCDGAFIQ